MNQMNTLLSCMLTAYVIPIAFVYYKYNAQSQETGTRSISSIITSTEPFILFAPDTSSATATTTPPCIPNETLHRAMYAYHGGVHYPL